MVSREFIGRKELMNEHEMALARLTESAEVDQHERWKDGGQRDSEWILSNRNGRSVRNLLAFHTLGNVERDYGVSRDNRSYP